MDFIYSFLFGITFKIYDDIIDDKIPCDSYYLDILKMITISLFTILLNNDIIFTIIWFQSCFLSLLMDIFYQH